MDDAAPRQLWDLSVPLRTGLTTWPGDPPVRLESVADVESDGYGVTAYAFGSHSGTHLDAPAHFFADGLTVADIPLEWLMGPCVVADLTAIAETITARDLDAAALPPHVERLLLKTRNSALWDDPTRPVSPDFIGLSADAADWIVARGIRLLGFDWLSIETGADPAYPAHRSLLGASVVLLEGIDLRAVSAGAYELVCLPLAVANADAAPVRAVLLDLRDSGDSGD